MFGGFLLGTEMPCGTLTRELKAKLRPITVFLLLPMFFTFSGLNTQLGLVTDPGLLLAAVTVLAASILTKGAHAGQRRSPPARTMQSRWASGR